MKTTRCRDSQGKAIYVGDILHIEEYPGKYVGESMDFEGLVTMDGRTAMVAYMDMGEEEAFPVSMFLVEGRRVFTKEERRKYWKTQFLGGNPPEELWKEELYRSSFK